MRAKAKLTGLQVYKITAVCVTVPGVPSANVVEGNSCACTAPMALSGHKGRRQQGAAVAWTQTVAGIVPCLRVTKIKYGIGQIASLSLLII